MSETDEPAPTSDDATLAPGAASPATRPVLGASSVSDRKGDRIGDYVLLERLGEGGFGVVWRAERREPFVQQVALKLLRPGMDSESVLARFELERQVLAMLDHPGIAKVLDGGVTANGRNYFVMELVQGEPVTEFCDRNRLPIRQRLELFAQVCDAVHHAHSKGVIHRDLKPGNILAGVADDGGGSGVRVKVIDFGVAKATAAALAAHDVFTQTGQLIGTPEFMSPEQADGSRDIDTRSDVYSLGVVLYQLLVGAPPFDPRALRSAGLAEIHRIIRDVDPPQPSTRLRQLTAVQPDSGLRSAADVARGRAMRPDTLLTALRGELDWLPMKAMGKDRRERYRSAAEFADDVRNYLAGRALIAGPHSRVYVVRKFVRRHRVGVAAVLAVAISLALATALSTWFGLREARARATAELVVRFQQDMLADLDPAKAGGALLVSLESRLREALARRGMPAADVERGVDTLRQALREVNPTDASLDFLDGAVLRPAAEAAGSRFTDRPEVEAALKQALAITCFRLGLADSALPLQARATDLRVQRSGRADPDSLESIDWLGRVKARVPDGRAEAGALLQEAVEGRVRALGETDAATVFSLRGLAEWLELSGRTDEALATYRRALAAAQATLPPLSDQVVFSACGVAKLLCDQGRPAEAVSALEPLKARLAAESDPNPRIALMILRGLAYAQSRVAMLQDSPDAWKDAIRSGESSLQLASSALGEQHPTTFEVRDNLATWLMRAGRGSEARPLLEKSVDIGRRHRSAIDPALLRSLASLGQLRRAAGDVAGAMPLAAESEAGLRASAGVADPLTQDVMVGHARMLTASGRHAEAIARLQEVLAERRKAPGPSAIRTIDAASELGRALLLAGRFADAERELAAAEAAIDGTQRPLDSDARWNLANQWLAVCEAWSKAEPAGPGSSKAAAVRPKLEALRTARAAKQRPLDWKPD